MQKEKATAKEFYALSSTDSRHVISLRRDGFAALPVRNPGQEHMAQFEGTWARADGGLEIVFAHKVQFPPTESLPGEAIKPITLDAPETSVSEIDPMRIVLKGDFDRGFTGGEVERQGVPQWIVNKTRWRAEATDKDFLPQRHRSP